MPRYLLLALNGPTAGEGDEATFNDWYDHVHIPELKAIPGITSARRYKTVDDSRLAEGARRPYLGVYEIETDSIQTVFQAMQAGMGPFSPTFDGANSESILAVEIGPDAG
jgi:hypothetical protein